MRTCYCGGKLVEVARKKLRSRLQKRDVRRFRCDQCGMESATTLTEAEELEKAERERSKEIATRSRKDY